jgi:adenine deaminase
MTTAGIAELIQQIPKAELHLHIEGTLEPELMFELAKRNNVKIRFNTVAEVEHAYNFQDLQSFLDIYYESCNVLQKEQDFYDLTWSYLARVARQNVRHVEIFFDPQSHTDRGIDFDAVVSGIHHALVDGQVKLGITSKLIMCFLRHLSADAAMQTLQQSLKYRDWITAVGLDSSEKGNPPVKFQEVFDRARAEGYLTVAHAGEEGPPDYIVQALDLLKVSRVDHGVRCVEDPELIKRLAQERIPLTVCPLSNVKLRVFKDLKDHPLKELLNLKICATVNSDDPAYFGGYVLDNYRKTQQALGLEQQDIIQLARNGFEASFLSPADKQTYFDELAKLAQTAPVK